MTDEAAAAAEQVAYPTRIGLVGYTSSRKDAPWEDPDWRLYGCNNLHEYVPWEKAAGWFDLHDLDTITSDPDHVKWLESNTTVPVYVWRALDSWPAAVPYPKDDILDGFSHLRGSRYFTNSISWMIAWAIAELQPALSAGQECHLGIYGVDMAQGSEYAAQRPSCEYWIGIAEAAGITVHIPDTSDLLKSVGLYGAEDDTFLRTKLQSRSKELQEKAQELADEYARTMAHAEEVRAMQHQVAGAKESNDYILGVWTQPRGEREGDPAAAVPTQSDGSGKLAQSEEVHA